MIHGQNSSRTIELSTLLVFVEFAAKTENDNNQSSDEENEDGEYVG